MRTPEEQADFLASGRFGKGEQVLVGRRISGLVKVGAMLFVVAVAFLGAGPLFGVGRDDGGPFLVLASLLLGVMGCVCFFAAMVRRVLIRRSR